MKLNYSIGLILLLFSLWRCKHEPSFETLAVPISNDSICFNTQILPLFNANCGHTAGCHGVLAPNEEAPPLTNYEEIAIVLPEVMLAVEKTTMDRMPPPPYPMLDSTGIQLLKRWRSEGALNRTCYVENCDTNHVTYTTHIKPIVANYCIGCHNSSNQQGNVLLDDYSNVKLNTLLPGKVICTIKGNDCSLMPKGGVPISKCDIRKFEIWSVNGFSQ